MAARYVALISPRTEKIRTIADRLEGTCGYSRSTELPGLIVLTTDPSKALHLPRRAGAIVGVAFSGTNLAERVVSVDDETAISIQKSEGHGCLTAFWGGYVAFIRDYYRQRIYVVRDPSGTLPCFYANQDDVTIISSDVDGLLAAGMPVPPIDWPFLARYFIAPDLRCSRTGLVGIFELQPGWHLAVAAGRVDASVSWCPEKFAQRKVRSFEENGERLRTIVHDCMSAWASVFPNILVSLSGGFDSSLVASSLMGTNARWSCQTLVTDEPVGDERPYARLVAAACGADLVEHFHSLEDIEPARAETSYLPRPNALTFGQSRRLLQRSQAELCGANAIFQGQGGDNVFCATLSAAPLVDRLLNGEGAEALWETAIDVCRLTGATVWEVAAAGGATMISARRYRWPINRRFLTRRTIQLGRFDLNHPWLSTERPLPPGRLGHIAKLLMILGTLTGLDRATSPDFVAPLLSQPIVEFCLGVPTWEWVRDGRDRSLARCAFAKDLPPEILRRRTKGTPDRFAHQVADRFRVQIRQHLIDGVLADNGLLVRDEIAKALPDDGPITAPDHLRLQLLAETESWVRHWQERARAANTAEA